MFGTTVRYQPKQTTASSLDGCWTAIRLGPEVNRNRNKCVDCFGASFLPQAKNATSLAAGRSFEQGRKGFGVTTHCGVSLTFFSAAMYICARFGNQLCMFASRRSTFLQERLLVKGTLCILQNVPFRNGWRNMCAFIIPRQNRYHSVTGRREPPHVRSLPS